MNRYHRYGVAISTGGYWLPDIEASPGTSTSALARAAYLRSFKLDAKAVVFSTNGKGETEIEEVLE